MSSELTERDATSPNQCKMITFFSVNRKGRLYIFENIQWERRIDEVENH